MLLPLRCHRRIVGRPQSARLYRDPPARNGFGTQLDALLAGPPRRPCEPKRCPDALADREPVFAKKRVRPVCTRSVCLGCRAVPGARLAAGPFSDRS